MNNIIPIHTKQPQRVDEHMRFCLARRAMNQALAEWLATNPAPHDVQIEVDASINVIRQLRDLKLAR
jgi:hypothetical protein